MNRKLGWVAAFAVAVLSSQAGATGIANNSTEIPGQGGHARVGTSACFDEYAGGARNTCGYPVDWLVPLPVSNVGWFNPIINVYAPDTGHTVGCMNISSSPDLLSQSISPTVYPSQFGVNSWVSPGQVYVNGYWHLQTVCWGVGQGARVNSVNY
jgi:hypothetical protein